MSMAIWKGKYGEDKSREEDIPIIEGKPAQRIPPKETWMKETPVKKVVRETMESLALGDTWVFDLGDHVHNEEILEKTTKKYEIAINSVRSMHRKLGKRYRCKITQGNIWIQRVRAN